MFNFYNGIRNKPDVFRQFNCRESLITVFNCPLENKLTDVWTQHNYIIYVVEGKKIWHTAHGSYELVKDSCVFVRKGAYIVEQFFDASFCLILFFMPDDFIRDVLKAKTKPISKTSQKYQPVITIDRNETLSAFFNSMLPYFESNAEPDNALLELKFRELILSTADNPRNTELISFFHSLLNESQKTSLQNVMDDNYCFNLKLEEFAQLCHRSLSAFKRDFEKQFNTTPGKWLLEKRLNHAMLLLRNTDKSVSESAFESGFENLSHFSRAFSNHFGIAPSAIKQQETA